MKHTISSEEIQRMLAAGVPSACTDLTINDASAQYYRSEKKLVLSWVVNNVSPSKFVVSAVFGFILTDAPPASQPFSYVQYGARQTSFLGQLDLPWINSVPDNSSKAFLRLTVADNNLQNARDCGIELPISVLA